MGDSYNSYMIIHIMNEDCFDIPPNKELYTKRDPITNRLDMNSVILTTALRADQNGAAQWQWFDAYIILSIAVSKWQVLPL